MCACGQSAELAREMDDMNMTLNTTADDDGSMSVLGLTFDPNSPMVSVEYFLINVFVCAFIVFPPLAGPMAMIGAVLFGLLIGMTLTQDT